MQLAPSMEHLGSTDELMNVLVSSEMHNDPALHKTWVELHASGLMCGTTKRSPLDNLSSYLSVNYDTHCRLEAAQRLEFQVRAFTCTHMHVQVAAKSRYKSGDKSW